MGKTKKDLLDSTGTLLSYVAAWMGGRGGEKDTCVCMAEFLCSPPETITTLLPLATFQYKIVLFLKNKHALLSQMKITKLLKVFLFSPQSHN